MELIPDEELRELCRHIKSLGRTAAEWAARESDDEFQSPHFVGGYDATEEAFCFSYYDASGSEYWFQLSANEVRALAEGRDIDVEMRTPD